MPGLFILLTTALVSIVLILTVLIVWEARRPPRHTEGYAVARGLACDPGELGMTYEAWWLDCEEGVRLPVWDIALGTGTGDLTVVFVHGWGHSKIDMLSRLDLWKDLASHIVLYDLRGHGEAEGALSRLGQGEERDLLALIERLGDRPLVLVGHSMGAVIAIHAAAQRDHAAARRIAGIVAYGPYMDFHSSLRRRIRRHGFPTRPLTDLVMLWWRLTGLRHRDLLRDVKAMECPLLIVHGDEDDIAPFVHAEQIVDAAADGALHRVPGAGHLDAHGIEAERHDEVIRAFISKLNRSAS